MFSSKSFYNFLTTLAKLYKYFICFDGTKVCFFSLYNKINVIFWHSISLNLFVAKNGNICSWNMYTVWMLIFCCRFPLSLYDHVFFLHLWFIHGPHITCTSWKMHVGHILWLVWLIHKKENSASYCVRITQVVMRHCKRKTFCLKKEHLPVLHRVTLNVKNTVQMSTAIYVDLTYILHFLTSVCY